jgi:sugar O-acyltransferase (sialic acid O-acetyltransferase NeuD family)
MKRLVLYGVGSPLVVDAEEACARAGIEIVAGVASVEGRVWVGEPVRVLRPAEIDRMLATHPVACVLFTPAWRKRAFGDAYAHGFASDATLVDPTSIVARSASIGAGTFVNAGCTIAAGCVIDERVLVNRSASIGHHARLRAYASIGPGVVLAGSVDVGRGATIGAGAVVLPDVTIGENAVVGAGSLVREPVPANSMVGGNPCRVLRKNIRGHHGEGV